MKEIKEFQVTGIDNFGYQVKSFGLPTLKEAQEALNTLASGCIWSLYISDDHIGESPIRKSRKLMYRKAKSDGVFVKAPGGHLYVFSKEQYLSKAKPQEAYGCFRLNRTFNTFSDFLSAA
jgi:hypothetical protein